MTTREEEEPTFWLESQVFCWLVSKLCFCPMMLLIHFRQPFSLAKVMWFCTCASSNCHLIAWHVQASFKIASIPNYETFPLKTGLKSVLGGSHFFFLFFFYIYLYKNCWFQGFFWRFCDVAKMEIIQKYFSQIWLYTTYESRKINWILYSWLPTLNLS